MSWPRAILHVDMDAFFASVEQRDTPALKGLPVAVGGLHRGVVAAASYEARRFGIKSAMPMQQAIRRCPKLIVVKPRFRAYQDASGTLMHLLKSVTPLIEPLSLDEAFLDVTASQTLLGDAVTIARDLQRTIASKLNLGASVGIAPSKFVAKLASDEDKPKGLKAVAATQVDAYLAPLPIARMWGAGKKTTTRLQALGITTFLQLRQFPSDILKRELGLIGLKMQRLAHGIDTREVDVNQEAKSVGSEATLAEDTRCQQALSREILQHCLTISRRLLAKQQCAHGLQLKLKRADFVVQTRHVKLDAPAFDGDSLYLAAQTILCRFDLHPMGYRLVGVAATHLQDGLPLPGLFDPPVRQKFERLEMARAQIDAKFGSGQLTRASLLGPAHLVSDTAGKK